MAPVRSRRLAAATIAVALYAASRRVTTAAAADVSVQQDILNVRLLALRAGCGAGGCMDETAAALQRFGCAGIKGFPTLSMMRARCPPPDDGGLSIQADLASLPNVVAVVDDFVVETSVPIDGVSDLDEAATRQVITGGIRGYWGLDRIDQRALPLDGSYTYDCFPSAGAGVDVFVLDTGCRSSHEQFGGRASSVFASSVAVRGRSRAAADGNGHGTHCAGTVGGVEAGVAKAATLRCIKVLSDRGSGSFSDILAGIEEVAAFKAAAPTTRKVVMSMSLGGRARGRQSAEDTAVDRAAALGVIPVVAAGNSAIDACAFTPARAASAITVANGDYTDAVARSSNTGACVDVIAPGTQILSADARSDTGLRFLSGTSMAAPHVSGIVALLLGDRPDGAALTSADVKALLTRGAPTVGGYALGYVAGGCGNGGRRGRPAPPPVDGGDSDDDADATPVPTAKPTPAPTPRSRLPSWWLDLFK